MSLRSAALKSLIQSCVLIFLVACSTTPEPLCSRSESMNDHKKCPAPAPPLTKRAELTNDELQKRNDNALYSSSKLSPDAAIRRKELLARIQDLKAVAAARSKQQDKPESIQPLPSFTVQLGAFRFEERQHSFVNQLDIKKRFIFTLQNGLYAVSVGRFAEAALADEHALYLRSNGYADAYVTKLPVDAVRIRE